MLKCFFYFLHISLFLISVFIIKSVKHVKKVIVLCFVILTFMNCTNHTPCIKIKEFKPALCFPPCWHNATESYLFNYGYISSKKDYDSIMYYISVLKNDTLHYDSCFIFMQAIIPIQPQNINLEFHSWDIVFINHKSRHNATNLSYYIEKHMLREE
jgi:hypothetical protein